MTDFYSFELLTRKKEKCPLSNFKGKVVIVVNTATGCGFTPQYEDLEKIQAPGTDEEIHQFCQLKYKTKFDQFKKSDVNGPNELPLFKFLKSQQGFKGFPGENGKKMAEAFRQVDPNFDKNPDIKWNFTKFVVDKTGKVVARFEPMDDMKNLEACVEKLL